MSERNTVQKIQEVPALLAVPNSRIVAGGTTFLSRVCEVFDSAPGRIGRKSRTASEAFWLAAADLSLPMTARLRNFIDIGC